MLRKRGFDTPHEVAYIEKKRGGLFLDGYFISTQCNYPPLSKVLWQRRFDKHAANELAAFMVQLHEKGVLHGDLNLTNILYCTDNDGHYHFTLIDTNRSKFKCALTRKRVSGELEASHTQQSTPAICGNAICQFKRMASQRMCFGSISIPSPV